jgi:hypothetical protein
MHEIDVDDHRTHGLAIRANQRRRNDPWVDRGDLAAHQRGTLERSTRHAREISEARWERSTHKKRHKRRVSDPRVKVIDVGRRGDDQARLDGLGEYSGAVWFQHIWLCSSVRFQTRNNNVYRCYGRVCGLDGWVPG